MSVQFELVAEARKDKGKGASRRLRRNADRVPAIVYGGNQEPASISMEHRIISKALESEAFYSQIINLIIDGTAESVILKDLQRHPAKERIMHADFQRVLAGQELTVHVQIHFLNETTNDGVKLQGGVLSHHISEVEVTCLPENLPEYVELDLANMKLGDILHLSDLPMPEGVELVALTHGDIQDHDQPVVSIHKPKGIAEEDEDNEAPEEAPEVPAEKVKKKDD